MNHKLNKWVAKASLVAILATSGVSEAATGLVRAITPIKDAKGSSYFETQALYKTPGDFNFFTFVDNYQDGAGYFGKTTGTRNIAGPISGRVQAIHCNDLYSTGKIGVKLKIPWLPKAIKANVSYSPINTGKTRMSTGTTID